MSMIVINESITVITKEEYTKDEVERMSHDEMLDLIIRKYGFEHPVTIEFSKLIDATEEKTETGHWLAQSLKEVYLRGVFKGYIDR